MKLKVYIDWWIISQTVFYYLSLMLTAQLLRAAVSRLRLLIASVSGGIMGLFCFIPLPFKLSMGIRLPGTFLLSGTIMLLLAFRIKGLRQGVKMFGIFFLVLLLLEALAVLFYSYFPPAKNEVIFLLFIVLIYGGVKSIISWKRRKENLFYPVTLQYGEKEEITLVALIDTGNRLSLNGRGVCIIDPSGIPEAVKEGAGAKETEWIEYQGVNGQNGSLPCYPFPKLILFGEYGEEEYQNVYVAESNHILSKEGKFQMILPARTRLEEKHKNIGGIYGLLAQKTHSVKRTNRQRTK